MASWTGTVIGQAPAPGSTPGVTSSRGGPAPPTWTGKVITPKQQPPHRPVYLRGMEGLGDVGRAPIVGHTVQFLDDATEGFAQHLAGTIAAPIDTVRNVMNKNFGDGTQDPNEVYNAIIADLDKLGVTESQRKDLREFDKNFGAATFEALIMAGGLAAAAPKLLRAGAGKVSKFLGRAGQEIKAHPVATAVTEAGAITGGELSADLAHDYAPGMEPWARLAGSIGAGGLTGLGAFRGTRGAREAMPDEPLFSKNANPEAIPGIAAASVDNQIALLDGDINSAMSDVLKRTVNNATGRQRWVADPSRVDNLNEPVRSARRFQVHAHKAAQRATVMENDRWVAATVDQATGARRSAAEAVQGLQDLAARIRAETAEVPSHAPQNLLRMIENLGPDATLDQLIGAGSIRYEALVLKRAGYNRIEGGGSVFGYADEIQTHIMNEVERLFPDDAAIAEANRFSRWKNDYFYRRNSYLRPFVTGTDVTKDADKLMANLIRRSGGGEAIAEVSRGVAYQDLYTAAMQTVRDEFRARVYGFSHGIKDPVLAAKAKRDTAVWLNTPEVRRFIQEAPREAADLELAANELSSLYAAQDAVSQTAFGKLAGTDIMSSIQQTLATADKAAPAVREVMANLRASGDVLATQGYQSAMANAIWKKSGMKIDVFERMLTQKGYKEIFDELLSPSERKGLQEILSDIKKVQAGDVGKIRGLVAGPTTWLNQYLASKVSSSMNPGSIQFSGKTVGIFTRLSERIFATLTLDDNILGRAIIDPHFRKLLHQQIPSNRRAAVAMFRRMTLMLSAATAGTDKSKLQDQINSIPEEIRKSIPKILLNAGERDRMMGGAGQ